ncbi:MAG: chemotaxis protein CheW [Thermodesulfovibrionales bacterium]|nr:chemotaxis protein CheW [Thermodesulfovibrionales bacterium]
MEKFIVFRLGTEEFGLGISDVVEILKSQKVCPIPELPDFISGVLTVRGDVIPMIDMRKRLLVAPLPKNERIIIVRAGGEKVGLVVDEVREITGFEKAEITKPPGIFKGLKTEYLRGLGKKTDRVVILIDVKRFLTSEETMMLQESKETFETA